MFRRLQLLVVILFTANHVRPDLTYKRVTAFLNVTTQSGTNLKSVVLIDSASVFNRNSKLSPIDNAVLINIFSRSNGKDNLTVFDHNGCSQYLNENLPVNFVAIIDDSGCEIEQKVSTAIQNNASALISTNHIN